MFIRKLSTHLAKVMFTAAFSLTTPLARAEPDKQQQRAITVTVKQEYKYLQYLPLEYDQDKGVRWPLVVFLHGAGERGTDLNAVKREGLPKVIESGRDFPFVMIAPQCPPDTWWNIATLKALIESVASAERIDRDRVYLTGLSMGGFGTWALAVLHPERYAAILPVCGGGEVQLARVLKDMPVWAFHGDADPIVPVSRTRDMINAVKRAGGLPRYTEYPGIGHDSWSQTYENPEIYEWLLSHRLSNRVDAKR